MIKINKIIEAKCELYDPNNNLIGIIDNNLTFTDVRCQINQQKISGYYVKWNDEILEIDSNGRMGYWPNGFYDEIDILCSKLLNI